ncbi:unnamed protein product [Urochloa humidicola]
MLNKSEPSNNYIKIQVQDSQMWNMRNMTASNASAYYGYSSDSSFDLNDYAIVDSHCEPHSAGSMEVNSPIQLRMKPMAEAEPSSHLCRLLCCQLSLCC